jgi:hypothetical protein
MNYMESIDLVVYFYLFLYFMFHPRTNLSYKIDVDVQLLSQSLMNFLFEICGSLLCDRQHQYIDLHLRPIAEVHQWRIGNSDNLYLTAHLKL